MQIVPRELHPRDLYVRMVMPIEENDDAKVLIAAIGRVFIAHNDENRRRQR
jgi:hypothetical protein